MLSEARLLQPEPRALLFAAEPAGTTIAQFLAERLDVLMSVVADFEQAQQILQQDRFSLLLVEETVVEDHPALFASLQDLAGGALVLPLNFGIVSAERAAEQVRSALDRRAHMEQKAMKAVMLSLRNELGASLSGLLLESQLALRTAGPELAPSLQQMVALAEALSHQLKA